MKTMIHAHRGAQTFYPENTMEAFSAAIEQGCDCIELDVHLTRDGKIVVAHDAVLERVSNGNGYINDHTLEELKSLDFSKLFPGSPVCRIPQLSEVLSLVKPSAIALNIELKTTERLYPDLPEKLIALTNEYGMSERVIYSSFNHYSLQHIKKIDPSAKIGLLYELAMVDPWVYANYLGADAIHPHYYVIAALPETVARCHENGVKVNVWTVDDPQAIKLMLKSEVDGIITNRPDIAVTCRNEINISCSETSVSEQHH
jgi:glycerophosphoryl diester phosphodiesterase